MDKKTILKKDKKVIPKEKIDPKFPFTHCLKCGTKYKRKYDKLRKLLIWVCPKCGDKHEKYRPGWK